ncbi:GNAT family N-acetyltransferase [Tenggerimyces flavus]|uniref:GNAT family N-acetyltransferase n=1 Tax=Tenggerimyces flavus TaxID=1708749 RepID=A0ABV7Y5J4_9ACTN|nr:GNAT family N-acetyltransferase [Tenggerimyces flavus]MBM7788566.1 RimJ/RimL family protein N-acetyltransferase [Tenggerimyces flavus]
MLREVTPEDLPALYEQQLDPEGHRMAAFGPPKPRDWEQFTAHVAKILADDACVMLAIVEDGQVVGSVGAFWMEGDHEVTYGIAREHWGRGLATKALAELLTTLLDRPLHARVVQDNAGSIKVLERNGFVRIGDTRAFSDIRQEEVEEWIYLLASQSA